MSGNKRLVYVMMKILKKCYEDVNITSFKVDTLSNIIILAIFLFQMKFAVDRSLEGRRYETDPIGPSLQRVLRYWTVRNKFEEARIHPDLREIGVTSIRVQEEGLLFERDDTKPAGNRLLILGILGLILAFCALYVSECLTWT